MRPAQLTVNMKLLFGLLFLEFVKVHFVFRSTDPAIAGYGAFTVLSVQLGALWTFRAQLPQRALDSVLVIPAWQTLVRWTVFACIAAALVQIMGDCYTSEQSIASPDAIDRHWAGWLAIALCVPLVEEIVFRAWLIETLSTEFPRPIAMVGAALLFGLVHLGGAEVLAFPSAFAGGLALGIAYLRSRSILPGFVAHALVNTAYLVLVNWG